ncbi:MAG: NERD domain-containing protein [Firmicutes bacterium]|nr:NERD domain-containing protein [Bacillota bacterium]
MEAWVIVLIVLSVLGSIACFGLPIYYGNQKLSGQTGEKYVSRYLQKLGCGEVINNLILEHAEGKTRQLDHIAVSAKGLFVIETKDRSGIIYGEENWHEWVQVTKTNEYKFYNPIKQNSGQVRAIEYFLKNNGFPKVPVFGFVIFLNGEVFTKTKLAGTFVGFIKYFQCKDDILTPDVVDEIYKKLQAAKDNSTVSGKQHTKNVKTMLDKIENNICPRCNSNLVPRKGRYGEFYGCSKYPSCKFVKKQ